MDELALLQAYRPDPAPPSAEERARMEDALLAFLHDDPPAADAAEPDVATPTIAPIDRGPRRRRALVILAVAATIVVVVGLAAVVRRSGEVVQIGPEVPATTTPETTATTSTLPADPAAALRVIADALERSPAPPMPYRVANNTDTPPTFAGSGVTAYSFEGGLTILTAPKCPPLGNGRGGGGGGSTGCMLFMPTGMGPTDVANATSSSAARAVIERWIAQQGDPSRTNMPPATDDPAWRAEQLVMLLQIVFAQPWATAPARAELLRMMADTPGLAREPDATNSFGQVGASFSLTGSATGSATLILTLDPADGRLLQVAQRSTEPRMAGPLGEDWITSYERPTSDIAVPTDVAQLAHDVARHRADLANMVAGARCLQAEAASSNSIFGQLTFVAADGGRVPSPQSMSLPFAAPPDLGFRVCW